MKTKTIKLKSIISIVAIFALLIGFYSDVFAQSLNEIQNRINELNQEIESSESNIEELRQKEDTLENQLAILDAEARQIQSEINTTQRQISQTKSDIREKKEELARTKKMIQESAKTLYKQGDPSTIEILFSSENFTDFINKREYLDRVKTSLNEAAREAVLLKEELEEKEKELQGVSTRLQAQRDHLTIKQQEQRRLIEETRGEEARYQELVAQQKEELKEAEREQAAIIAASRTSGSNLTPGSVGNGGYPVEWAPPVPMNSRVDLWGFYSRQCTSYAAWKRFDLGREIPAWGTWGIAHARFWANSGNFNGVYVEGRYAQRSGYEVNNTPAPGAIAVLNSGTYGHLSIVEEVFDGGARFRASEYNANWDGYFTNYYTYNNTSAWSFIHN